MHDMPSDSSTPVTADKSAGILNVAPAIVRGLRLFARHIAGSSPVTHCEPVIRLRCSTGKGPVAEVWAGTMVRSTVTYGG